MGYTPSFTPQYENGWENLPSETSPITAEAFNAYDDAIENIEEYLASDESQANLADAYDETATYEAGDYVIYGGDLYKCLEDIDEPEEWDSTKWESCLITDEMATSGGTTVIANPEGTATATLNKLQVEETIYSVEGGGGSANIWTGTQAEYESQASQIADGTLVNITDDEQEVVEGGTIYSTDEQCIGLWTDNKPLYQRTYNFNNVTLSQYGTADIATLSNIDHIHVLNANCVESSIMYDIAEYGMRIQFTDNNKLRLQCTAGSWNDASGNVTVQYTKTTDAPLDAVVGKKTMYIASSDCYSTEEKEIGCFTDGKPLYQRTIYNSGGNMSNYQYIVPTPSDLSGIIEHIVDWKCSIHDVTHDRDYCLDHNRITVSEDVRFSCYVGSDNTPYFVVLGATGSSFMTQVSNIYITIQYTKTTDTAGSGSYTPASGKAVYYSTNEQVIGKWSNGKPLYRKCVNIASFSSNDVLIANAVYYGNFLLSNYISDVDMAFLDLNHSYLGTSSTFTRTILNAQYEADTGYFTLFTIYSRQNVPLTLVIEYTKTTD